MDPIIESDSQYYRRLQRNALKRAQAILDENPENLTAAVKDRIEKERTLAKSLGEEAELLEAKEAARGGRRCPPIGFEGQWGGELKAEYRDANGRPIYVLKPEQRLAQVPGSTCGRYDGVTAGHLVGAWLAPSRRDTACAKRALSEGLNSGGGIMVADELSTTVIDLARSQSVLIQAGAQTVPMSSDSLMIARVASDPTFSMVPENTAVGEGDPTFDAINLVAKKIGCIVRISREIAEDAPNLPQLLEQVMAEALAVEIDRQALLGTGSSELEGLHLRASLTEASIGAVTDYTEVISAITKLMNANQKPNAWILNPTMHLHYEGLKAAVDGQYLAAPPSVAGLKRLVTSSLPATGYTTTNESPMFILDGTQVLFGVRRAIEVSRTDQRYWDQDQIGFKVTVRLDTALLRSNACCYCSGAKIS